VDNIRIHLGEVRWGFVDWIGLAQDRDRWRVLVTIYFVPQKGLTSITRPGIGVFLPSPEDGKRYSFRNVVVSTY
jgi:hypothetical protein